MGIIGVYGISLYTINMPVYTTGISVYTMNIPVYTVGVHLDEGVYNASYRLLRVRASLYTQ